MSTHSKKSAKKPYRKKRPRTAVYTRKTTCYGTGDDFSNNDAQRMVCETIIKIMSNDFVVLAKRYDDAEVDEENIDRAALQELFADIEADLVDAVVVYSMDILSTDFKAIEKIMKFFKEHDVRIILAKQGIDSSTPNGRRFFRNVADLIYLETVTEEWKNRKIYEEDEEVKDEDKWVF